MRDVKNAAAALSAVLIGITVLPVPALAAQDSTSKEEVFYVNLNSDGSAKEINVVTIDAGAGKLYYEGKPKEGVTPWIIAVHYYMDGMEYSDEQIAGMSGKLGINMTICRIPFVKRHSLRGMRGKPPLSWIPIV